MKSKEYRTLIFQFIASLCLCDHMGDVCDDIDVVLKKLGINIDWNDLYELGRWCGEQGITTLYNTSMKEDEE